MRQSPVSVTKAMQTDHTSVFVHALAGCSRIRDTSSVTNYVYLAQISMAKFRLNAP